MNQELLTSIEYVEKEKGVSKEVLLEALKQALLSACRKSYTDPDRFSIEIDPKTCEIKLLANGQPFNDHRFGRIAAQTAKQVIIQKIREAERESVFDQFYKRVGDIITGNVHRVEPKAIVVDLGKAEGILPSREQSPVDQYRQGHLVRSFVVEVRKSAKGPEIILSRAHAGLVQRLFELEVPEIHDGIVQMKGAAREAGSRTKISVFSKDDKIDCVGSCVGIRGQRVKNIVRELGGEKIDIVRYSDDMTTYIRNAMAPAELKEIRLIPSEKKAEIVVNDDQLSLAIGKRGQNVRLASKLVGWQLDVRSVTQKIPLSQVPGLDANYAQILTGVGVASLKDLVRASVQDVAKVEGIGEEAAAQIMAIAKAEMSKYLPQDQAALDKEEEFTDESA